MNDILSQYHYHQAEKKKLFELKIQKYRTVYFSLWTMYQISL